MLRDDDHPIGAPDVAWRERRIVASNLGLGSFRVVEKVQVMDRDEPGGIPGRNQERMGGLCHVDGARETLHRRPFKPVPEPVQQTDGYPTIDDRCARDGVGGEAILPGRREEDQGFVRRRRRHKRRGRLMDVFADAGALAKRGSVVDENPHNGKWADAITRPKNTRVSFTFYVKLTRRVFLASPYLSID